MKSEEEVTVFKIVYLAKLQRARRELKVYVADFALLRLLG